MHTILRVESLKLSCVVFLLKLPCAVFLEVSFFHTTRLHRGERCSSFGDLHRLQMLPP
uniref:Uncharacterized protein n=1 Tax=Helianthus annuus TaxID=4232 RepID=A0A251RTW8_HELAN